MRNQYDSIPFALECLVKLMKGTDSSACPLLVYDHIPSRSIFLLAKYNKAKYVLKHFISCSHCRPLLSSKEHEVCVKMFSQDKQKPVLHEYELQRVAKIAKQLKTPTICIKDARLAPKLSSFRHHAIGSDVDVLVSPKKVRRLVEYYRLQGYAVKKYEPKEFNVTNPVTHVTVDLHTMIAFPHFGDLNNWDHAAIDQFSKLCLKSKRPYLSRERLLIAQIIRFWSNDMCRGLRQIQDVFELSSKYESSLSWRYITKELQRLQYYSRYQALLLIGKNIFGYSTLPASILQSHIPPRILWIAQLVDAVDVAHIDNIMLWHTLRRKQANQWYLLYNFLSYVCDSRYSPFRIIRPRFFFILCKYIYRTVKTTLQYGT